jgi:RND superfamily putative drug exporter
LTRVFSYLTVRLAVLLVPAWIAAAVACWVYLPTITQGSDTSLGGLVPTHAPAIRVQEREVRHFGTTLLTRVVVVQPGTPRLTGSQLKHTLVLAASIDTHRNRVLHHVAFAAPIVSPDRTTTVSYLYFHPSTGEGERLALAQAYAQRLDPPGVRGGPLLARNLEFGQIRHALPRVTLATIGLIVLILLATFRAPGPPLLVLAAAGLAYSISVHVLAFIGRAEGIGIPKEVEPVLVALLLGLVTDYSIFFLTGVRRRLAEGASRLQAAQLTMEENVPIVLTAGLIVALGALTLLAGRLAVFRSFGPGMTLTVAVTLAVALTFVPAVLALGGPLVFRPSLAPRSRSMRRRAWRILTARPVSALVAALAVAGLVMLAAGLGQLRLGFSLVRGESGGAEVKVAQARAEAGFPRGILGPSELLVEGARLPRGKLVRLQRELAAEPGVAFVLGPREQPRRDLPLFVSRDRSAARYLIVLGQEPLDAKAVSELHRVRDDAPSLAARAGLGDARLSFAGDTALAGETVSTVRGDGLRVGAAVLGVNLVLLALFLRAIWRPLMLLAAGILALAAALGGTTWIMQGWLGHDDLTYYVPFAVSVLLLSLGSDYNIFVVGRIRQAAERRPMRDAIAEAAPQASSTITTAGITLAGSFALLALIPVRPMRELALAMTLGILLDTFVVRSVLVPTLLALFRRREPAPPTTP